MRERERERERGSSSILCTDRYFMLKFVNNTNFKEAARLLNQADPPRLRGGGRRAQVTEIKDDPPAKVSGSSIQTSSFVCV